MRFCVLILIEIPSSLETFPTVCFGEGVRAQFQLWRQRSQDSLSEPWQRGPGCLATQKPSDASSEAQTPTSTEAKKRKWRLHIGDSRSQGPGTRGPMGPAFLGSGGHIKTSRGVRHRPRFLCLRVPKQVFGF